MPAEHKDLDVRILNPIAGRGYEDACERYTCRACGAQGDASDVERGLVAMPSNRAA